MIDFEAHIGYQRTALAPILSPEALDCHYKNHHCVYAKKLNALVQNTQYIGKTLEEIIAQSRDLDEEIFNNAAQLFNHDFYWNCLKLNSDGPTGTLKRLIEEQFRSFDIFLDQYESLANGIFGSGWSWIVCENGRLDFLNKSNAGTPIGTGQRPICVIDVWEHAYYVDYRNDKAAYVRKIIRKCINWEFCSQQLD
ncbi:MAG: superoxide dismutase [Holosporaceae bacterium]|jgi:Fe-Mn family superoxide dismutase|nr:superoxide dismutase [Holosporaceae bacterium]